MTLDDLIQVLQAMRAHHGNLPVYLSQPLGERLLTGVRHTDSMPERVVLVGGHSQPPGEPSIFEQRKPAPGKQADQPRRIFHNT